MERRDERSFAHSKKTKETDNSNLGPFRRSKVTRIIYVLFISTVIFLCMIILTPQVTGFFQRGFCHDFNQYYCDLLVGYDAAYRLGFALAIWFIILAFATLGITSSADKRANVQNSLWGIKVIGLLFLVLLLILIPHNEYNGEIWLFFGLNAAFCFIILQYTFILDATNSFCILYELINENRHHQFSDFTINLLRIAKTFTTVFLYSVSLTTCGGFYLMYGSLYECLDNFVFLTFHLIMCFASSVISLLPVVREASPQVGLFQCAVTSLYCTYVIWLAFSSQPHSKCNPSNMHTFPGSPTANIQVWVTLFITFSAIMYICSRDLVAPQFGKVEKISNTTNKSGSLNLTCNLQGGADDITRSSNLKNEMKGDYSFDHKMSTLNITNNLKRPCTIQGNEESRRKNNVFAALKRFFQSDKESRSQSKESELGLSDLSRPHTTTKEVSLVGGSSDTTLESENVSLVWDDTVFLSATTNLTSDYDEILATRSESSAIDSSNVTTTATKDSLTLTKHSQNDSTGATEAISAGQKSLTNILISPSMECNSPTTKESTTKDTSLIWDDEVEGIEYSYPFFHLTFSLATLYLIMSITNWYRLDEGEHLTVRLVQSWSAVWLRISASIFCSFILIWSMVIPLVFPDSYKDLLFFQYLTSLPES